MAETPGKPSSPFAKLASLRDVLPPGDAKAPAADPIATAKLDPIAQLLSRKVVVRRERKGRGGKTVTLVQFTEGCDEAALDGLSRELRKALGTAAQPEGGCAVAVHGDIADRVADWLGLRGATRIVRGS